jgi:hypothetical protein
MTEPATVADLAQARVARAERAERVVQVDPDPHAEATCSLPGCRATLYITWTASRAIFLADTADELADPDGAHTASWEVSCEAGHVVLLPPDTAEDAYVFGECDCDGEPELLAECGHNDMARLRRVVA